MIKLRSLLTELSPAGQQAKKLGLQHVGYGRYADRDGQVVAKSERGQLVRLRKPEPAGDKSKASAPQQQPQQKQAQPQRQPQQKQAQPKQQPEQPAHRKERPELKWYMAPSDVKKIPAKTRWKVATRIDRIADIAAKAKAEGKSPPDINLCKISIPGTNLYCGDNLGIPREDMPQFKGKALPDSPASRMLANEKGEVDTEPVFRELLKRRGVKVEKARVPSDQLKATQSELVGAKVAGMTKALEQNPNHPGITAPIYVSRDGYVIDGHHRWAAVTSNAIARGEPAEMDIQVIDMDAKEIIPLANKFAEEIGIAAKKGAVKEGLFWKEERPERVSKDLKALWNMHDEIFNMIPVYPDHYKIERMANKMKRFTIGIKNYGRTRKLRPNVKSKADTVTSSAEQILKNYERARTEWDQISILDHLLSRLHNLVDDFAVEESRQGATTEGVYSAFSRPKQASLPVRELWQLHDEIKAEHGRAVTWTVRTTAERVVNKIRRLADSVENVMKTYTPEELSAVKSDVKQAKVFLSFIDIENIHRPVKLTEQPHYISDSALYMLHNAIDRLAEADRERSRVLA